MAKYRMVRTDFWKNPIVSEEMTPEDRYFYLYLLTNPHTTQTGIYRITKKQMAFDLGYSLESVHSLIERFTLHHKLIRYNPVTRELAIKNWGKYNLRKGGKPVMDCICSELKEINDTSLIPFVLESIDKQEIRSLYESFCKPVRMSSDKVMNDQNENDTYLDTDEDFDDTSLSRHTIRAQKEKEEEKEKQKQKQQQKEKAFNPNIENNPDIEAPSQNQKSKDVKEIIEFWDNNGFGFSNVNAKEQLLSWLDDSSFLQPKDVILKAMAIACANNKRRLNYVVGILKNWENESLLTANEIDAYQKEQNPVHKQSTKSFPGGRDIPSEFELDLTAGEE
ncbi:DnaD domain protein [uncultured Metabacillus sp.]|uniref:DnaD domain-containing protein n=1 Tax=uncultured Metabacillus sp. TaxID=2860135 RepID=UPI0026260E11|nr:DnaD domain protein [uncultured Metabacillus sp.]